MSENLSFPEGGHADCLEIEEHSFWFRHRNHIIVEAIKRYPPSGTLYDVGGGNGYVSLGLKRAGYEVTLVEPGAEGVKNARARGILSVIPATLREAGLADHSLEAVGLFDVLEHIEDESDFLSGVHDKLKHSGDLYITVPAYNWLWSYEDEIAGHFRRYTVRSLSHLLSQHGFSIKYGTYFFSFLPLPIYLSRTLPSHLGLKKNSTLEFHKKQHSEKRGLLAPFLGSAMHWELSRVKKGYQIPFGGSCLVCAVKV